VTNCGLGYSGVACRECSKHFYPYGETCKACPSDSDSGIKRSTTSLLLLTRVGILFGGICAFFAGIFLVVKIAALVYGGTVKQGFKRSLGFVFWMALVMQLLAQVLRNVPSVIKQKHFPVLGHVHDFLAVTQLDFSHVTVHQACLDLDLDMATIATVGVIVLTVAAGGLVRFVAQETEAGYRDRRCPEAFQQHMEEEEVVDRNNPQERAHVHVAVAKRVKRASAGVRYLCKLLFFLMPIVAGRAFTVIHGYLACDNAGLGCRFTAFDFVVSIVGFSSVCVGFPIACGIAVWRRYNYLAGHPPGSPEEKYSAWTYFTMSDFALPSFWMRHLIRYSLVLLIFCDTFLSGHENFKVRVAAELATLVVQLCIIIKLRSSLYRPSREWKKTPRMALLFVSAMAVVLSFVGGECCNSGSCDGSCKAAVNGLSVVVVVLVILLFLFIAVVFVRVLYVGAKQEEHLREETEKQHEGQGQGEREIPCTGKDTTMFEQINPLHSYKMEKIKKKKKKNNVKRDHFEQDHREVEMSVFSEGIAQDETVPLDVERVRDDQSGKWYSWNRRTGSTKWLVQEELGADPESALEDTVTAHADAGSYTVIDADGGVWQAYVDEGTGKRYFYNAELNETSWEPKSMRMTQRKKPKKKATSRNNPLVKKKAQQEQAANKKQVKVQHKHEISFGDLMSKAKDGEADTQPSSPTCTLSAREQTIQDSVTAALQRVRVLFTQEAGMAQYLSRLCAEDRREAIFKAVVAQLPHAERVAGTDWIVLQEPENRDHDGLAETIDVWVNLENDRIRFQKPREFRQPHSHSHSRGASRAKGMLFVVVMCVMVSLQGEVQRVSAAGDGAAGHYLKTSGSSCPAGEEVPNAAACQALADGWEDVPWSGQTSSWYEPPGCFVDEDGKMDYNTHAGNGCGSGLGNEPCICRCPSGRFSSLLAAPVGVGSCRICMAGEPRCVVSCHVVSCHVMLRLSGVGVISFLTCLYTY